MNLPYAPRELVGTDGKPCFGLYRGVTVGFGWDALAAPFLPGGFSRRLRHKRWHFVTLSTDELFCGLAIVDAGWVHSAFAYAFDRTRREVVASVSPIGLPGVSASVGTHACAPCRFRSGGGGIDIELHPHGQGGYQLRLQARNFRIDALYRGKSQRLLAVRQVEGGTVHATQKSTALRLSGVVHAGGRSYCLDGGIASFDYSNGMLGRTSDWHWVSAHSREVGINLQAGYFGASENALWLDGAIIPLGAARFDAQGTQPLTPWRVRTDDGLVDLQFTPEGMRRDVKQLLLASSRLRQQFGTFEGWVKAAPDAPVREVRRLTGLTEEYRARW
ncbi:DUF2804 domain-containing protein [Massilia horti]|uniref:DUF2804 domain-containing protein n=1 Tax=Massilia horti TaxID=2562153 RepID=A0A4Y9SWF2_9BURK|nr:DUF2804 domain-containing protein [Massilia horti]TFW30925.1 DUF2804 domain-containing protein [Massilia horti]